MSWRAASAEEQSLIQAFHAERKLETEGGRKEENGHEETMFVAQVFFWQSVNEDDEDVRVEPSSLQLSQINECVSNWQECDRSVFQMQVFHPLMVCISVDLHFGEARWMVDQ